MNDCKLHYSWRHLFQPIVIIYQPSSVDIIAYSSYKLLLQWEKASWEFKPTLGLKIARWVTKKPAKVNFHSVLSSKLCLLFHYYQKEEFFGTKKSYRVFFGVSGWRWRNNVIFRSNHLSFFTMKKHHAEFERWHRNLLVLPCICDRHGFFKNGTKSP